MTDLLDQSDIDALLAAVESGDAGGEDTQSEENHIFAHDGGLKDEVEIRSYDFKRPERVSKDQMRALEGLHEGFARSFGALISGFLRTIIEVNVASIEQMTFSEFTHSLPNPTCFTLLEADRLEGHLCLEISPLIVYPIIDRLLGGSNADLFIPQRPLTAIEMRLVSKIIDRARTAMGEAWEAVIPVEFSLSDTESNPQLVQIVPPNEVVVVIGFEIKMGSRAGTMSLCIPYNVIEPVMDKLSNQTWAAYKRKSRDLALRKRVVRRVKPAKVTVTALLADTTITVGDLMRLQRGDLVLTDKPASTPLTLKIADRRKYIGHLGQFKGNRAFKVARPLAAKDRV